MKAIYATPEVNIVVFESENILAGNSMTGTGTQSVVDTIDGEDPLGLFKNS